jgi:hypothetical protein
MSVNNTNNKLELILGRSTSNVEQLFNDIKELYELSLCPNIEGPTINHTEDSIMNKYGMTQNNLVKNLDSYSAWVKNIPIKKNSNLVKTISHDGIDMYL